MKRNRLMSLIIALTMIVSLFNITPVAAENNKELSNVRIYAEKDKSFIESKVGKKLTSVIADSERIWKVELWHYSGNHWGGNISQKIYDKDFRKSAGGVADLKDALTLETQTFSYLIQKDSELHRAIDSGAEVFVNISSNTKDFDSKEIPLTSLYDIKEKFNPNTERNEIVTNADGTLLEEDGLANIVKKSDGTYVIEINVKPKLNYYDETILGYKSSYSNLKGLKKYIPLVKNGYGHNLYSIWGSTNIGAAQSWIDAKKPHDMSKMPKGMIHPDMIKNVNGELKPGYQIDVTQNNVTTSYPSEKYSIGAGTFANAGAVGLRFISKVNLSIYVAPKANSNQAKLVKTYVKFVGENADGSPIYEQLRTKVEMVNINEKNAIALNEEEDIEEGSALLNDVIISSKDLTADNVEVNWADKLPKTISKAIAPTAEDVKAYGVGLRIPQTIEIAARKYSNKPYLKDAVAYFNQCKELQHRAEMSTNPIEKSYLEKSAQAAYLQAAKLVKLSDIDFNFFSDAELREILKTQIADEELTVKEVVDNADIIDMMNAELNIEKYMRDMATEGMPVTYVRYLVIPNISQRNLINYYKNGVFSSIRVVEQDLVLVEETNGINSYRVDINDITQEPTYKNATLTNWATSMDSDLNTMPTNSIKTGNILGTITGLKLGENLYVSWRIDENVTKTDFAVPEWRLSKYNDTLDYKYQASMWLNLRTDRGHARSTLSPSGPYNYYTVNPNGQKTSQINDPTNMKFTSYLHSKAKTKGNYPISHGNPSVSVDVTGNANLIKSREISGISPASWVSSNNASLLAQYGLTTATKGTTYSGPVTIIKSEVLKFGILNKDIYTHNYSVYYHYSCGGEYCGGHCGCYTLPENPKANYGTADYAISMTFSRYVQQNTDARLFKAASVKNETNGKTTVAKQESTVLNVYPEYAMLFDNDAGQPSIVFAVSDIARKIQPVSFHTMTYNSWFDSTSTGTSVATSLTAKKTLNTKGWGNLQVLHKGSGVNTNYVPYLNKNTKELGNITIKTYALDVSTNVNGENLKAAWGNSGYDTAAINNNYLSAFAKKEAGKWVIDAVSADALVIDDIQPKTTNPIRITEKSAKKTEYPLTIRGGKVELVAGKTPDVLKSTNPELYEALVGMKLIDVNNDKSKTVFATFEHRAGAALTEQEFKDLAKVAKGNIDNLAIGEGWNSEDTVALKLVEYETVMQLPMIGFSDKIPMTVKNLTTPIDKNKFYTQMLPGHTLINYTISSKDMGAGLGVVKASVEHINNKESKYGPFKRNFATTNVSITDSFGF